MLKIYDILNEIIKEDSIERSVAIGKVSASKAKEQLRNLGVNFDGECSISIGSIDDFRMNSYLKLIPYGDKIVTPGSQKSKDTYRIYSTSLNFSPSTSKNNNTQKINAGEQITFSGMTFEYLGQQWGLVSNKKIWVDNKNFVVTDTKLINKLNFDYTKKESLNKILTKNNIDYIKTNVGWATYNKSNRKSGMIITKKTSTLPNQTSLDKEWFITNPPPTNYKIVYNGFDYFMSNKKMVSILPKGITNSMLSNEWINQNNQQNNNQITNTTILKDIMFDGTSMRYDNCEIEFYEFNSSDINQILNKNFKPKKINSGENIKCKKNYYIKILKSNPRINNCDWGVLYITQLEK
jgi:hypothetical protein